MSSFSKHTPDCSLTNVAVRQRLLSVAVWFAAFALTCAATAASAQYVAVRIIAINDFHGHLEVADNTIAVPNPSNGGTLPLRSGGAAFLAARIAQLKTENPRNVVVSAGDLIGASPLTSALFHDEPTIEVMNAIGLEFSALGNHEFDHGVSHLLRLANGGCEPQPTGNRQSCAAADRKFSGARFPFAAANVVHRERDEPLIAPTWIKTFDGVRIGFIGAVTRSTPGIVVPAGIRDLRFVSEAKALNQYATQLQAQGVQAIIAVVHEGGESEGGYDGCRNPRGAIFDIVRDLHPAIDVVLSAHTHRGYNCQIDGRVVIQGASYGRLVSVVDVEIDRTSGDVVRERTRARNVPVPNGTGADQRLRTLHPPLSPDPTVAAIVEHYRKLAAPLAQQPVGRIVSEFDRRAAASGDSALGRLIADAHLSVTQSTGAQVAFTNPGGLRADLRATGGDGVVTYADAFKSQPFGNTLVTVTLTGAQLKQLLEQQWSATRGERARMLQPSRGFSYTWRASGAPGNRVIATSMQLDGRTIEPDQGYRITVNNFLADGGDGFRVLREGTDRVGGPIDVDALTAHLKTSLTSPPLQPDTTARIVRR